MNNEELMLKNQLCIMEALRGNFNHDKLVKQIKDTEQAISQTTDNVNEELLQEVRDEEDK